MVQVASASKSKRKTNPLAILLKNYTTLLAVFVVIALGIAYVQFHSYEEKPHHHHSAEEVDHHIRARSESRSDKDSRTMRTASPILSASSILASGKPYLLYGTAWKEADTARHVADAIRSGFRFIDTACQPKHYQEHLVGEGWTQAAAELGLKREDISLQTKFTSLNGQDPKRIPYDKSAPLETQVRQSVAKSLENLQTDYLDTLVLHSPMQTHSETMTVWKAFEEFVDQGKVRKLGVSNCYDLGKFTNIYNDARIKPSILQNRFYMESGFDVQLRSFCAEHDIKYQSFWTLTANRQALASTKIKDFAAKKGLTPQTLMYAYMMQNGHTPLDGTTNKEHMAEDVAVMKRILNDDYVFKSAEDLELMEKALGVPKGYTGEMSM